MTRDEMLSEFETFLNIPPATLVEYANEDAIGGFNFDASQSKWPGGSLWEVEGQAIYALVRALKPIAVLELGTHRGCSTTHLAAAVLSNGSGSVLAVDVWEGAGDLIPDEMRPIIDQVFADAVDAINSLPDQSISFVFEDLLHGTEQVAEVIEALKPKLTSRAVVVHHDSEHGEDGVKIRRGIERAGIENYLSILAAPSDCGLAVWRAPQKLSAEMPLTHDELEGVIEGKQLEIGTNGETKLTPKPAVHRTPTKKAPARKTAKK